MQAALGVFVQLVGVLLQISDQCFAVLFALFGLAQAIEFQPHIFDAQFLPQSVCQQNQFGIHMGAGKAQGFGTHLMKLAVAAALGPFAPKHGPHVVHALAAFVQQVVFHGGTYDACGVFGAQGQVVRIAVFVVAILKRIHFLFHHIGYLAQAAHKQAGVFDDGGAHIAIGKARHDGAHFGL